MKRLLIPVLMLLLILFVITGCSTTNTAKPAATTTPAVTKSTSAPVPTTTIAPTATKTITPTTTVATTSTPKRGGVLKIAQSTDARMLGDPMATWAIDMQEQKAAVERLARFNEKGMLDPWLALSWAGDSTAKTFTVKLRTGVKFHDGTDFNAEAVKWNWARWKASPSGDLDAVSSIDVIDTYTVRANLSVWENTIEAKLLNAKGGMVSPTAWKSHEAGWGEKNPVGTGPFEFVSWTRDVGVTYKKFNGYWQSGKPYLDGIQFVVIVDSATKEASFKKGEIDVIWKLDPPQVARLKSAGNYILSSVDTGLGTSEYFLLPDGGNADSIFANPKIRAAVEYAIDKKSIVDSLTYGLGTVTNQWGLPTNWAYNKTMAGHAYDPKKAKALLAEAGYPNGFETTLRIDPYTQPYSESVQAMLAEAGIKAKLQLSQPAGMTEIFQKGWKNELLFVIASADGDVAYRHARSLKTGMISWVSIARSKELDAKLDAAIQAPDFATKQSLTWQNQDWVFDKQAIVIPLWVISSVAVRYPYVHNDGINTTHTEEWTPEEAWLDK